MRIFLGLLSLLLLTSFVQAETIRRTVSANKTTSVGAHGTYKQNCQPSAIPRMKVSTPPKNGTVSFKQVSFKLSEDAGRCAGRTVKGTAVYYKPNRGFRGEDVFRVRFTMDMYGHGSGKIRNIVNKYVIKVK